MLFKSKWITLTTGEYKSADDTYEFRVERI